MFVELDISILTNVLPNAQLAMETLQVNVKNVMITVLLVMDSPLCALPVKTDLPLIKSVVFAKKPHHVNSDNITPLHLMPVPESAPQILTSMKTSV